ncbi:hypothetical protein M441DRAFT_58703 [Trichoderma asperellum CBS 433.97]|uniref:Uncharacterized protein n=1 Tax=Trichoderma asperellum (strain ATCC 204424 / CBS 433.97 / NBRC 101777) TaxID=1042311 RepID=A0A2T3Z4V5_TRIA4|nr:hypothetical protein M441DRAFT_58703 [Trichoderma asperellum CBS 433.97]PTB39856.1 hypothetical protein M441DRAFT_58703 [Trichoderma asperellum CBS 433.97]
MLPFALFALAPLLKPPDHRCVPVALHDGVPLLASSSSAQIAFIITILFSSVSGSCLLCPEQGAPLDCWALFSIFSAPLLHGQAAKRPGGPNRLLDSRAKSEAWPSELGSELARGAFFFPFPLVSRISRCFLPLRLDLPASLVPFFA